MNEVREYLESKGWTYTEAGDELRLRCPFCRASDEASFSINAETGAWKCHRGKCDERGRSLFSLKRRIGDVAPFVGKPKKSYNKPPEAKISPLTPAHYQWFAKRAIPRDIVDQCGITQSPGALVFDFAEKGRVVNRQYRHWPEKGFHLEPGCKIVLWGMDRVISEKGELIITEGQIDAMTVMSWGREDVVSMPNGVGNLEWIDSNWEWLEAFDTFYLMTDEDEPGEGAALEISRRLPNCRRVLLGFKDANDAAMGGMTADQFAACLQESEWMNNNLLRFAESYEEELLAPEPPKHPTGFPKIDAAFEGGIPRPSVNVISGYTGEGKTTVLSQIVQFGLEQPLPLRTVISSNEMPVRKTIAAMIRQSGRIPGSRAVHREWYEQTVRGNLLFLDLVAVVDEKVLFEYFELAARRYAAKVFVIDSLSRVDLPDAESQNAREKQFMNRVVQFSHQHEAIVWVVSHLRKPFHANGKRRITIWDIKGSGSIADLSSNVFGWMRNTAEEQREEKCDAQLSILKNRETGRLWSVKFQYHRSWDRYSQIERQGVEE